APEAQALFLALLQQEPSLPVRLEAARGLAVFAEPGLAKDILAGWASYPPAVRVEVVNLLAGNRGWARALMDAVAAGRVEKTALNANTVLRMRALRDRTLDATIERLWGKVRPTPAELNALIEKMRGELTSAPGSFARGKAVFENQCAKCHQFEGRGH